MLANALETCETGGYLTGVQGQMTHLQTEKTQVNSRGETQVQRKAEGLPQKMESTAFNQRRKQSPMLNQHIPIRYVKVDQND